MIGDIGEVSRLEHLAQFDFASGKLVVPGLDEIGKTGTADKIDPKSLEQ